MSDMTLRAWSRKAYHPTASRLCVQSWTKRWKLTVPRWFGAIGEDGLNEIFSLRVNSLFSVSDSQRETSGVRVFRPLASESETLDWSRKERSRVRIGCRSACGNERCELVVGGWVFSTRSVPDSLSGNFLIMIENSRHLFSFLATAKSSFGISFSAGKSSFFSSAIGRLLKAYM